jgi:ABC-type branched-subunit amino acid transport system permease subunit
MEISTEIAIVAMLGGAGTLIGPLVGSITLETASEIFKNFFKEANLLIYGVLIVVVVLFLPEGIVGTIANKLRVFKAAPIAPFDTSEPPDADEEAQRAAISE